MSNYNNNRTRSRSRTKSSAKTVALTVVGILAVVLALGLVLNATGVFAREPNPDNLLNINKVGKGVYAEVKAHNEGLGVTYTVHEDGSVSAKGKATADDSFTVATGIELVAGETYVISCGNDGVGYQTYGLRLRNVTSGASLSEEEKFIYADIKGAFEVPEGKTLYNVEIYVMEGVELNETFYPCLVKGETAGDFYE